MTFNESLVCFAGSDWGSGSVSEPSTWVIFLSICSILPAACPQSYKLSYCRCAGPKCNSYMMAQWILHPAPAAAQSEGVGEGAAAREYLFHAFAKDQRSLWQVPWHTQIPLEFLVRVKTRKLFPLFQALFPPNRTTDTRNPLGKWIPICSTESHFCS